MNKPSCWHCCCRCCSCRAHAIPCSNYCPFLAVEGTIRMNELCSVAVISKNLQCLDEKRCSPMNFERIIGFEGKRGLRIRWLGDHLIMVVMENARMMRRKGIILWWSIDTATFLSRHIAVSKLTHIFEFLICIDPYELCQLFKNNYCKKPWEKRS